VLVVVAVVIVVVEKVAVVVVLAGIIVVAKAVVVVAAVVILLAPVLFPFVFCPYICLKTRQKRTVRVRKTYWQLSSCNGEKSDGP